MTSISSGARYCVSSLLRRGSVSGVAPYPGARETISPGLAKPLRCCSVADKCLATKPLHSANRFLFGDELRVVDLNRIAVCGSIFRIQRYSASASRDGKEYKRPWHNPSFMERCSPETIEQWLVALLKSNRKQSPGDSSARPGTYNNNHTVDSIAYLRVLEAYAKSRIGGAPQKAEYWIGQLERHYSEVVKSYLQKYTSYATHQPESGSATLRQNDTMPASPIAKFLATKSSQNNVRIPDDDHCQKRPTWASSDETHDKAALTVQNLQPTVQCYNALIEAWGNDNDKVSVVRSRRWLSKLEEGIDCPFPANHPLHYNLSPDAQSYDLYLHSCSRGIGRQQKLLKSRAEEAEGLLKFRLSDGVPVSIRPTTESYNYVLRAWTRCRKEMCVADRVMNLVKEMEAIQREYIQNKKDKWKQHIYPDAKTYTMVIDAWTIVASLKASKWYSQQLELSNTYNQIANKRSSGVMEDRKRFFERRNKYSDGTEEMENAAAVLKYVQTLEAAGKGIHSVVGYNTILSGWARLANEMRPEIPLKSESILREMMEFYKNGNENLAPDLYSFNAVRDMI
jgi:hypothetical protein